MLFTLLRWSGRIVVLSVGVLLAMLLLEMTLRLVGFSYPAFHEMDDRTGLRLRAGAEGWYRTEGKAYVRINADGLRDRERPKTKPANTVRVAVLGDSYIEALQVPLEATFAAQLERALNACRAYGERAVEVLNFGVSNYGTAQQLLTLRERAHQYAPDLVLLAFLPSNDVRNNSKALERGKSRPFFEVKDGKLLLDASFARDPAWQESKRLGERRERLSEYRAYQLLRKLRADTYRGWNDAPTAAAIARAGEHTLLADPGPAEYVFRAPPDAAWRDAWHLTERLLEALHQESRARGAEFMVAVLSTSASVYPERAVRERYAAKLGVRDLFYPDRRIARLGADKGFDVVSLGPPMRAHAEKTRSYLHGFDNTQPGFGHWNAAGHALAARLVAEQLCSKAG